MMGREVVWCWSLNDSNIIFIFRQGGKELRVNLKTLHEKATVHQSVLFNKGETELLLKLLQELKQIK